MNSPMSRRSAVTRLASSTAAAALMTSLGSRLAAAEAAAPGLKGRVNHSVCKWCYPNVSLDDLCKAGKEMGLTSVELLNPGSDFETLKKHGLACAMVSN